MNFTIARKNTDESNEHVSLLDHRLWWVLLCKIIMYQYIYIVQCKRVEKNDFIFIWDHRIGTGIWRYIPLDLDLENRWVGIKCMNNNFWITIMSLNFYEEDAKQLTSHGPIPSITLVAFQLQTGLTTRTVLFCWLKCVAICPWIGILTLRQPEALNKGKTC